MTTGSSVHGLLQTRILEWVAMRSSRGSSNQRIEYTSPALAGRFFTTRATWGALLDKSIGGQFRNIFSTNRIKKNLKGKYNEEVCHSINYKQRTGIKTNLNEMMKFFKAICFQRKIARMLRYLKTIR